jgi:hypothetical protein
MVYAARVPFLLSKHSAVVVPMLCRWESNFLESSSIGGNEVLGGEVVFTRLVVQRGKAPKVSF